MKQVPILIEQVQLEKFKNLLPDSMRNKLLNDFVLTKYQLPSNEVELKKLINDDLNTNFFKVRLKDESLEKLEQIIARIKLIAESINPGINITSSHVLRDVISQMNDYYSKNPVKKPTKKTVYYIIDQVDLNSLDKYSTSYERSKIINEFLQHEFTPSSIQKTSVASKAPVSLSMEKESLDRIEELTKKFGVKKTDVLRFAIKELIIRLKDEHHERISNQLESVIKEHQESGYEIKNKLNQLLNND